MPLLAGFIGSVIAWLGGLFGIYYTKKSLTAAAAVATFVVMTLALYSVYHLCVAPFVSGATAAVGQLSSAGHWMVLAWPPAASNVVGCLIEIWSACELYKWKKTAMGVWLKS